MAYTGRFETTIVNHVDDCRAHVHFRDVLPDFTRPVWQSLQVQGGGLPGVLPSTSVEWNDEDGSAVLTVLAYLEPLASLQISLDYQPAFLPFQAFPGDPNRGFEAAPAVVTMTCSNVPTTILYSNALLILPPIPDMSMPFNVTSLTCSLYAYVFGGIIAMLVKKSSDKIRYALHPEEKPKSPLARLKEKIRSKFQKKQPSKTETVPITEATTPLAESHEKAE
jgi:phosphatidylinositol glycan class T